MAIKKSNIDDELKAAHRDKYLAQAEAAKSQKLLLDLEFKEKAKLYSKSWIKKKETWAILIGTLVAWTAVGFYITTSIIPLSEIHNNQVTLENTKKSDTLYEKEKQLKIAYDTLKHKELNLEVLNRVLNQEKNSNSKLKIARHNLDSSYSVLVRLYKNRHFISLQEIQGQFAEFRKNLNDYQLQLKAQSNHSTQIDNGFFSSLPNYDPKMISTANYWPISKDIEYTSLDSILGRSFLGQQKNRFSNAPTFSQAITLPSITLRPFYNGTLIKNLTIKVYMTTTPLLLSELNYQKSWKNDFFRTVEYSDLGNYVMVGTFDGTYSFEVVGNDYKVDNIVASDKTLLTMGNIISSLGYKGDLTIDLNLVKL